MVPGRFCWRARLTRLPAEKIQYLCALWPRPTPKTECLMMRFRKRKGLSALPTAKRIQRWPAKSASTSISIGSTFRIVRQASLRIAATSKSRWPQEYFDGHGCLVLPEARANAKKHRRHCCRRCSIGDLVALLGELSQRILFDQVNVARGDCSGSVHIIAKICAGHRLQSLSLAQVGITAGYDLAAIHIAHQNGKLSANILQRCITIVARIMNGQTVDRH